MQRPPRAWGMFAAGLWFGVYAFVALFNLSGAAPIVLAVLAFIAAVFLVFGE